MGRFVVTLLVGAVLAKTMPVIVSVLYLVLSLVTFLAYALDKSAAESGSGARRKAPCISLAWQVAGQVPYLRSSCCVTSQKA